MSNGRLFVGRSFMLEWFHIIINVVDIKTFTAYGGFLRKFAE
jgi:hypothetical protein